MYLWWCLLSPISIVGFGFNNLGQRPEIVRNTRTSKINQTMNCNKTHCQDISKLMKQLFRDIYLQWIVMTKARPRPKLRHSWSRSFILSIGLGLAEIWLILILFAQSWSWSRSNMSGLVLRPAHFGFHTFCLLHIKP